MIAIVIPNRTRRWFHRWNDAYTMAVEQAHPTSSGGVRGAYLGLWK